MHSPPPAVIWDLDGTLVDTAELHYQAWLLLAAEMSLRFTRQDFTDTFGWRNAEIVPRVFGPSFGPEQIAQIGDRKEELYRAEARKGVPLLPGAAALLRALHAGGFRQAIGSSAPRANIELLLDVCRIRDLLSTYACAEDTTRGKPHPEVFLAAARKLDVPPSRCVVIEDAPVGVQAAKAGNMKAVGVTFAGHHPAESLRRAGADVVVASLEELHVGAVDKLLGLASPGQK